MALDIEWSSELIAEYRRWLFSGPEGDIDQDDPDLLAKTQETAFEGGFNAGVQSTVAKIAAVIHNEKVSKNNV